MEEVKVCIACLDVLLDQAVQNQICDEEQNFTYADCLKICTNVDMTEYENLCSNCGIQLKISYAFHEKVMLSQRVLKGMQIIQVKETYDVEQESDDEVYEAVVEVLEIEASLHSDTRKSSCTDDVEEICQEHIERLDNISHCSEERLEDELDVPSIEDTITTTEEVPSIKRERLRGQYNCDFCDKLFPNHSRMKQHRLSHQPDSRPKYACADCGRMYATNPALVLHINSVHKNTGYKCEICSKLFPIKKSLDVHMRFHVRDFPYQCDLCGRMFAQNSHLKTHNDIKHNNLRFSCQHPNCGKQFTSSSSLRNHEFSHGLMPFECSFCQRDYPSKSKLKVHVRRKHKQNLTLEELEPMRRFYVMRSKTNLMKVAGTLPTS